jgi:tetratricopeptide (TPR) repeat protein
MKCSIYNTYLLLSITLLLIIGCSKDDFLNKKPDNSLVVPETLQDFQALLDNDNWMNGSILAGVGGPNPFMGEFSSDNVVVSSTDLTQYPLYLRNLYTWQKDIYETGPVYDWNNSYRAVFYSNVVLDGLSGVTLKASEQSMYDNIKGSALFFRAHTFYQLAQVFAVPYNSGTASQVLGIPLRLKSDVNEPSSRATLKDTYDRVVSDLKAAINLLPINPLVKTRPSKPAAYGLLARVYQTMEDYDKALVYSDSCLLLKNELLDYNALIAQYYPIPALNTEVIFSGIMQTEPSHWLFPTRIDNSLYELYADEDLRKTLFFMPADDGNGFVYWGSYDGSPFPFAGIATDELYLIKAECLARLNKPREGLDLLNNLLEKRWVTGQFEPVVVSDNDVLSTVLTERRKELVMRGLRWTDLRRLNNDPRFAKELQRTVDSQTYTLPANGLRYALPIPNDVITMTGMQQNNR